MLDSGKRKFLMLQTVVVEAHYDDIRWWEAAAVKYMGQWKWDKNGGGGYTGDNDSGRGDGMFDEDGGGRDELIRETAVSEKR